MEQSQLVSELFETALNEPLANFYVIFAKKKKSLNFKRGFAA